jgi:acetoacetyl-CoA synthetase
MTTARSLLWTQTPENIANSQMMKFMNSVNAKYGLFLKTYKDLHKFSIENLSKFWSSCWDFFGIISKTPYDQVVDESLPIYDIPKWFQGSLLNYTENLLVKRGDGIALISECEDPGRVRSLTWDQLRLQVGQYSAALRDAGIKKGDRVAALVPNTIESVVFMLATAAVGAIW